MKTLSTAELRIELSTAFKAAFNNMVVRVTNHNKPYVAIVSHEAGDVVRILQKPDPTYDEMAQVLGYIKFSPQALTALASIIVSKIHCENGVASSTPELRA